MPGWKKVCCVIGCGNTGKNIGMYGIPVRNGAVSSARRMKWLEAIDRRDKEFPELLWDPENKCSYVCSEHFVKGKPSMDKMDVDYAPTIFPKRPAAAKASTSQKGGAKGKSTQPLKKPTLSEAKKKKEQQAKQAHTRKVIKNATKSSLTSLLDANPVAIPRRSAYDPLHGEKPELKPNDDNTPYGKTVWETTDHDYVKTLCEHSCMTEKISLEVRIEELHSDIAECKTHMINLGSLPDEEFPFFTGLSSRKAFETVCAYLEERPTVPESRSELEKLPQDMHSTSDSKVKEDSLSFSEELFLVLVKLKRGYCDKELSFFFGVQESYVNTVFASYIHWLFEEFKFLFEIPQAEARDVPGIVVVLDFTERHALQTTKFVIGVSPQHVVEYVSPITSGGGSFASFGTSTTVTAADLLDVLPEGSCLMAEQEFFIREDLLELGVELIVPCASGAICPPSIGDDSSERISEAFKRMEKMVKTICSFRILEARPMREVKDIVGEVFTCCAYLVNLETAPETYTYTQGCNALHL